jgi:hypothetical protein
MLKNKLNNTSKSHQQWHCLPRAMQHYSIINEMIGQQQMQKEKVESNDSEEEEFMVKAWRRSHVQPQIVVKRAQEQWTDCGSCPRNQNCCHRGTVCLATWGSWQCLISSFF